MPKTVTKSTAPSPFSTDSNCKAQWFLKAPFKGVFLFFVLSLAACTSSSTHSVPAAEDSTIKTLGQLQDGKLLSYKLNQITEFTLGKFDPTTGEHWITTLKRTDPLRGRSRTANWEFTSLPDGKESADRRANATFVMHLLDSILDMRKIADAPHGSLDSFGLEPPRYLVRLKTETSSAEFQIGARSDDQQGNYLTLDQKEIVVAKGSALKMLPMIQNFEFLRDRNWTNFSTDDVDEFILSKGGKPFFYAQREGGQWTDKNHKPVTFSVQPRLQQAARRDAETLLRNLTEVQSQGFVDDPELILKAQTLSNQHPGYEVQLLDRHGKKTSLKLVQLEKAKKNLKTGQLFGISSARPDTLFALDPKFLSQF